VAIQIKSDGTFSIEYVGPYAGLNVAAPETNIPDNASPAFNNFMLRNAEIRSRPAFVQAIAGPGGANPQIGGIDSFLDINGTYHTVLWTNTNFWQYNPLLLPAPPWSNLGSFSFGPNPVSYRAFANIIYWTNVSQFNGSVVPKTSYWDGITANYVGTQTFADASTAFSVAGISLTDSPTVGGSLPGGPTIVGPIAIGAQYLSELNNQLILANVSILDQGTGPAPGTIHNFPNLIWWSANGLPLQWDPTQNISAGFNPFLDVSDQITGLSMQGVAGFIFRTYGITQMTPTGSSVTPWEFDHMWASERGIGSVLPWSIAQYGPTTAFVAEDNIYSISIANATPIGGTARDAIMADIANAVSINPVANIIPTFSAGYVYLTYQLILTLSSGGTLFTRFWIYSFEDKNWSSWDSSVINVVAPPNSV
jgi:hypothetical protein